MPNKFRASCPFAAAALLKGAAKPEKGARKGMKG
jgi:hypothetical protein